MAAFATAPVIRPPRRRDLRAVHDRFHFEPRIGCELSLSNAACVFCHGSGRVGNSRLEKTCSCVFRGVFRAVLAKWHDIAVHQGTNARINTQSRANISHNGRRQESYGRCFARLGEEFLADVEFTAMRVLSCIELGVFRRHYLLGLDCTVCCAKLGIDKGEFFHHAYRIQKALGREFATMNPFPLYPVAEYFRQ